MKPCLFFALFLVLCPEISGQVVAVLGKIDTSKGRIGEVEDVQGKFAKGNDSLRANVIREVKSVEKNGFWNL